MSKKVENKLNEIRKAKLEVTKLEGQIQQLKQERQNLGFQRIYGDELIKRRKLIDHEVKQLESEKEQKELEAIKKEFKIQDELRDEIVKLKEDRNERLKEVRAEVDKMNQELFEAKLEYLKQVFEAGQRHRELQEEIDELSSVIGKVDKKDGKQYIGIIDTRSNRYGLDTSGVAPTPKEMESISKGYLNPQTVPASTRLFILKGIVERNNIEASKKLKGAGK